MTAEWDSDFVAPWHGFPGGTATCSVVPLCQSTLTLVESEVLLPGREGVVCVKVTVRGRFRLTYNKQNSPSLPVFPHHAPRQRTRAL